MSVVERCPLYGGVILCFTVCWDENICPLFGGVRCAEMSVNGGSTVLRNALFALAYHAEELLSQPMATIGLESLENFEIRYVKCYCLIL